MDYGCFAFDDEQEKAAFLRLMRERGETGQLVPAIDPPSTDDEWFEWSGEVDR